MPDSNRHSPAYQFLAHMWQHHDGGQHGRSWQRLNQAMVRALRLAIEGGLIFAEDDFARFVLDFNAYRWIGEHSGEYMYTVACRTHQPGNRTIPNRSAARAYEAWRERKPFLWQKKRLAVGTQFSWKNHQVVVTSFDDDAHTIIACAYHAYPQNHKVAKRFRITRQQFRAAHKTMKGKDP